MSRDPGLRMTLRRCRYTKKGVLATPLRFQIAPLDEFGWDVSYNWTDYETISQGQFTSRGGRQLRTLNVSTLAMDWSAPWAVVQDSGPEQPFTARGAQFFSDLPDLYGTAGGPWKIAQRLDNLVTQGTPMLLVVNNPDLYQQPDVRMMVSLRSASLKERAGEPDARYFDLSFTEYRLPRVARRNYGERHDLPARVIINKEGVAQEMILIKGKWYSDAGREVNGKRVRYHRIGSKDSPATLRKLAKHYYGTPKEWKRIAKRNDIAKDISGDESLVKIYDRRKRKNQRVELQIPAKQPNTGGVRP